MCLEDDVLVLSHGDVASVAVIKKTFDEFNQVSRLFLNFNKSTVFFRSVPSETRQDILNVVLFQVGKLPTMYLGVPLLAKKIGVYDCKNLVDKVVEKIICWRSKFLLYAGSVLIAYVLSFMKVYRASVYMLPITTIKELEKLMKGFLWCQGPLTPGKAKVAWKVVCMPKEQGGLAIKSLKMSKETLLIKKL
nr:hypothetical protein [Tanacetum cinerariifolium]